jgi:hypothetical protein
MRKSTIYFVLLFFPLILSAQDTLTVQTFTWDSETRSGDFVFPDASEGPFEKILMTYNMRCNNAQVGSGAVGCREWDYSCNTFITVPEMTDSLLRFHPSHIISNYDGDLFGYSNTPVYTYYQYNQVETSNPTPNLDGFFHVIDGSYANDMANNPSSGKVQMLYTAEELTNIGLAEGEIDGMVLDNGSVNNLSFLKIKLKHTAQTELSADFPELHDFSEVYFKNTTFPSGDWEPTFFHTPFEWDGTSNILVEMSFFHTEGNGVVSALANDYNVPATLSNFGPQYALEFNGGGNIILPDGAFESISDEVTLSLWVNGDVEALPRNTSILEGTNDTDIRQVNVHLPWSNSRVYWDCGNDGSGYDRIDKAASESELEGQWNHWAFTKNATTGDMKIFLNGVEWHSGTGKIKPIDLRNLVLASAKNGGNKFYGQISEFRLFNKALDEATIAEWMRKSLSNTHPNFSNLVSYYPLNEGVGTNIGNPFLPAIPVAITGSPGWREIQGEDFFKNFTQSNSQQGIYFTQNQNIQTEEVTVIDSIINIQSAVVEYAINPANDLEEVGTSFYWEGEITLLYDEDGNIIDIYDVPVDGEIPITTLEYHLKRESKLELLSMVTPYGNGLDLGFDGKTFTFDVSDFGPILNGERFISIEMGGQWQEDLDIQFHFIKGTPPREVLSIQNLWAFERGWYQAIVDDTKFETRTLSFDPDGDAFKLRSSVTGHGQNGEFVPRSHYLNLNGGSQEYIYQVWKECGYNPVYPQGGTWIFDRAGWCPGMATDVHEFDISDLVTPGGTAEIDYGVNGAVLSEANYLVSNQMVTYGAPNFTLDAAIESIMRPSQRVEYERLNPACNLPQVVIKNTGTETLTSLQIDYGVQGGMSASFDWSGSLGFLETEIVDLPVDDVNFWATNQPDKVFEVNISNPNGGGDQYENNNGLTSTFAEATVLDDPDLIIQTRTNNRGNENRYTIKDYNGDVVLQRNIMFNNSIYDDEISLPPGCYSLDFEDDGDDGLEFWYWAAVGQNVGNGSLAFKRVITPTASIPVKTFDPDFGGGLRFDFVIPQSDAANQIENARRFSVYPNPAMDVVSIEMKGFEHQAFVVQLLDLTGKVLKEISIDHQLENQVHPFTLPDVAGGMYYLKISNEEEVRVREIVILD